MRATEPKRFRRRPATIFVVYPALKAEMDSAVVVVAVAVVAVVAVVAAVCMQ